MNKEQLAEALLKKNSDIYRTDDDEDFIKKEAAINSFLFIFYFLIGINNNTGCHLFPDGDFVNERR